MVKDQELRDGRLVFYEADLEKIDKVLEELVRLTSAKSVLLVDKEGHMITRAGLAPSFNQDTISALVAGSFSATREMARILGEKEFSALYHQGERDNIQLSLVGDRTILTILFDEATTLGMIRLYCGEAQTAGAGGCHGLHDEGEDIKVHVMSRLDALERLASGSIVSAPAVIALQWLALNHARLRNEWGL